MPSHRQPTTPATTHKTMEQDPTSPLTNSFGEEGASPGRGDGTPPEHHMHPHHYMTYQQQPPPAPHHQQQQGQQVVLVHSGPPPPRGPPPPLAFPTVVMYGSGAPVMHSQGQYQQHHGPPPPYSQQQHQHITYAPAPSHYGASYATASSPYGPPPPPPTYSSSLPPGSVPSGPPPPGYDDPHGMYGPPQHYMEPPPHPHHPVYQQPNPQPQQQQQPLPPPPPPPHGHPYDQQGNRGNRDSTFLHLSRAGATSRPGAPSASPPPPRPSPESAHSVTTQVTNNVKKSGGPGGAVMLDMDTQAEREKQAAELELSLQLVQPIKTDFHFFVNEKQEPFRKAAEQEVREAAPPPAPGQDEQQQRLYDAYLFNSNLNARLKMAWEHVPADERGGYLKKEEADRRRFMEEDQIASRHCATLTSRLSSPSPRKSPKSKEHEEANENAKRGLNNDKLSLSDESSPHKKNKVEEEENPSYEGDQVTV